MERTTPKVNSSNSLLHQSVNQSGIFNVA